MIRREFIALLGGAVAAWPLIARAQQLNRMRRIGVLVAQTAEDSQSQARNAAFLQGLGELGWNVGRNLQIDYRWGGGDFGRFATYAAELLALSPEVILAVGASIVGPLLQATRTVPVVFIQVADPVGSGFVSSLARPARQRDRICPVRIWHQREMDRTAERDRAPRDASQRFFSIPRTQLGSVSWAQSSPRHLRWAST